MQMRVWFSMSAARAAASLEPLVEVIPCRLPVAGCVPGSRSTFLDVAFRASPPSGSGAAPALRALPLRASEHPFHEVHLCLLSIRGVVLVPCHPLSEPRMVRMERMAGWPFLLASSSFRVIPLSRFRLFFDFRLSTFDFRLSTFDFRLSTFDFRLLTFDFRLLTFDF